VRTYLAAPIFGIIEAPRQQFTGTCRLDDIDSTIGPQLRALSVEWDEEVQPLARVGVRDREQCGIGDVEAQGHECGTGLVFVPHFLLSRGGLGAPLAPRPRGFFRNQPARTDSDRFGRLAPCL